MRITNFIKNYPCTMFLIFFISVGIFIVFINEKIHATDTNNTPGCSCESFYCTTYQSLPNDSHLCSTTKPPNCKCLHKPTITICPGHIAALCTGTVIISSGCSSSTRSCSPDDCNPKCDTPPFSNCPNCNCQGCKVYEEIHNGNCVVIPDPQFGDYLCDNKCSYKVIRTY